MERKVVPAAAGCAGPSNGGITERESSGGAPAPLDTAGLISHVHRFSRFTVLGKKMSPAWVDERDCIILSKYDDMWEVYYSDSLMNMMQKEQKQYRS